MIFNELIENIQKISNEKTVKDIVDFLNNWKKDNRNVDRLDYDFEKYLGNIWIENSNEFNKIYEMWKEFKNCAILNLAGMTMNERLYVFGLFEKFDSCKNTEEKNYIYEKLNVKADNNLLENIKDKLQELIKISENKIRENLYKNFYNKLIIASSNKQDDVLNSICNNFSGLMVHAEIKSNEYNILESLLNQIEKYLK
jgi:hypothetical protein